MVEISDGGAVGPDGLFETYLVRSGIAYQGWFLVASVMPTPQGDAQLETAFIVLDPQVNGSPRPLPDRLVVRVSPGTLWRELLDTQITTALRSLHEMLSESDRQSDMPEPERPQAVKVSSEKLLRLYVSTRPLPDDDPVRLFWLEGLARLRNQTGCRALRAYLDTFMPAALRVERD